MKEKKYYIILGINLSDRYDEILEKYNKIRRINSILKLCYSFVFDYENKKVYFGKVIFKGDTYSMDAFKNLDFEYYQRMQNEIIESLDALSIEGLNLHDCKVYNFNI